MDCERNLAPLAIKVIPEAKTNAPDSARVTERMLISPPLSAVQSGE